MDRTVCNTIVNLRYKSMISKVMFFPYSACLLVLCSVIRGWGVDIRPDCRQLLTPNFSTANNLAVILIDYIFSFGHYKHPSEATSF